MFVDYSCQAYILSCNGTDYSFFGSQTTGQTGVRVVRVSGHNTFTRFCSPNLSPSNFVRLLKAGVLRFY